MADEHRRRAIHALTRDVALAFWKMASAQRLRNNVHSAIRLAREALDDYAAVESAGIRAPEDALRQQRQLLENIRLLSNIERDFGVARVTLASLVNLPVDSDLILIEPDQEPSIAILALPLEQLEEVALKQNGELSAQLYKVRIAKDEVRKSFARLIPGLRLDYHLRQSSDSFLVHDMWQDAGFLIAQNLVALAAAPANHRLAKGGVSLEQQRFVALQMALLAQMHIARLELNISYEQLQLAGRINEIDEALRKHADNRVSVTTASKLSRVSAYTGSIVSRLRRYQAHADLHAASSILQATLGSEIEPAAIEKFELETLIQKVSDWQLAWNSGYVAAPVSLSEEGPQP